MTTISAKVVADSISPAGVRLTTLELVYPRFIHAELLTHRAFSRCSASSRAIPVEKLIEEASAAPLHWGKNKPGMQADEELQGAERSQAIQVWLDAMLAAKTAAAKLSEIGVHKQTANRLLEPFMHMHTLVSSTEWENFFQLRISPLAQPEMCQLATAMRDAINGSTPANLRAGQWHTPYIDEGEEPDIALRLKRSVARCARVSRNRHGKTEASNSQSDHELFEKLTQAVPMHASPLEHVATPLSHTNFHRNFRGWQQYRSLLEEGAAPSQAAPAKSESSEAPFQRTVTIQDMTWGRSSRNLQINCKDVNTGETLRFSVFWNNGYKSDDGSLCFKELRDKGKFTNKKLSCKFKRTPNGYLRCLSARIIS